MRTRLFTVVVAILAALTLKVHTAEPFFPLLVGLGLAAGAGASAGAAGVKMLNGATAGATGLLPTDAVSFFEHDQFRGQRTDFPVGSYPSLTKGAMAFMPGVLGGKAGRQDDTFTSAIVPTGYKVQFYFDPDFKSPVEGVFTAGQYPNVGGYWNDKISSLIVSKA